MFFNQFVVTNQIECLVLNGRRGAPPVPLADGLKINCVRMKSTELKMLWKLVKSGEKRRLSAADLALLMRVRFALQEYEAAAVPTSERRNSEILKH